MPAPLLKDADFIELWKVHKSAAAVAEVTGMGVRAVKGRRRRIEQRRNINLEADDPKARTFSHLGQVEYKANHQLGIENGIIIAGSDAHIWPGPYTTAFRAFIKFIKELQPKAVIANGDMLDGASISRHPPIGWEKGPSLIEELKACQIALGDVEDAAGRAKLIWPLGNHDSRLSSRLATVAPEYANVHGTQLKDHFPAWTPCWATWVNERFVIKHRMRNGIHAVHNNTVNSGVSIATGHLHSAKVTPFTDYNGTRFGVDLGTLAEPKGPQFVNYLEANPTNWRSAFAVFTIHKGRLLWPELVHVFESGKVEFRGKVIAV
jgi:hypothetical protein